MLFLRCPLCWPQHLQDKHDLASPYHANKGCLLYDCNSMCVLLRRIGLTKYDAT